MDSATPTLPQASGQQALTVSPATLRAALLIWVQQARAGQLMPARDADASPAEEVAADSAKHLWALLCAGPQATADRTPVRPVQPAQPDGRR